MRSWRPGPSPDLTAFFERASHPYREERDTYQVGPFTASLRASKSTPLYHLHTYWSKKPHEAVKRYIEHYTSPGDLVLDPFCGAGGTALMALSLGRKALAIDLSPAATFIAHHYTAPVDLAELGRAFARVREVVAEEMEWLYATRCDRCGGRAVTDYMVYSEVFRCPQGWEPVPLYDAHRRREEYLSRGRTRRRMAWFCPEHGERIETRRAEEAGYIPVEATYTCLGGGSDPGGLPCRPARSRRNHRDEDPVRREYFQRYDLGKLAELDARHIPYWYPTAPLPEKALSHRLASKGVRSLDALFTKRNLWALALFLDAARRECDGQMLGALEFLLSGSLLRLSRMLRAHHSGMLGSFYHLPTLYRQDNALVVLEGRYKILRRAKAEINSLLAHSSPEDLLISTRSALDLDGVPDSSMDYIFTDPPYGDRLPFWELNLIWEGWLGFDTSWNRDEVVINRYQGKGFADWSRMMGEALAEMYRVLKPGRWLTLCYHDSSPQTWREVVRLAQAVGFALEGPGRVVTIEGREKSYMQRRSADSLLGRDLVLNLEKPKRFSARASVPSPGEEPQAVEGEEAIVRMLRGFIGGRESVPYSELFEHYLYAPAGKPQRELEEILADYFVPAPGGWRNPGTGAEEERLAREREGGLRRRIRRTLKALEEGRLLSGGEMLDDATLAQWLHYAYQKGMWREGVLLYERGGISLDAFPAQERQAIREDYETCRLMSEQSEDGDGP